jgi:hypothetical protein
MDGRAVEVGAVRRGVMEYCGIGVREWWGFQPRGGGSK